MEIRQEEEEGMQQARDKGRGGLEAIEPEENEKGGNHKKKGERKRTPTGPRTGRGSKGVKPRNEK